LRFLLEFSEPLWQKTPDCQILPGAESDTALGGKVCQRNSRIETAVEVAKLRQSSSEPENRGTEQRLSSLSLLGSLSSPSDLIYGSSSFPITTSGRVKAGAALVHSSISRQRTENTAPLWYSSLSRGCLVFWHPSTRSRPCSVQSASASSWKTLGHDACTDCLIRCSSVGLQRDWLAFSHGQMFPFLLLPHLILHLSAMFLVQISRAFLLAALAHSIWAVIITAPTKGTTYALDPGASAVEWLQQPWVARESHSFRAGLMHFAGPILLRAISGFKKKEEMPLISPMS
jgi:hypothetical protein